MSDTNTSMKAT